MTLSPTRQYERKRRRWSMNNISCSHVGISAIVRDTARALGADQLRGIQGKQNTSRADTTI